MLFFSKCDELLTWYITKNVIFKILAKKETKKKRGKKYFIKYILKVHTAAAKNLYK